MLTYSTLLKLPLDKIIDDFEDAYLEARKQLTEIKRSKDTDTSKSLRAIKLVRQFYRTGGKI